MREQIHKYRYVIRYFYAMIAVVIIAVAMLVVALYLTQAKSREAHDRVAVFHLGSTSLTAQVASGTGALEDIVSADQMGPRSSRAGGDAEDVIYALREDMAQLFELQHAEGAPAFDATLGRVASKLERVEHLVVSGASKAARLAAIESLALSVRQLSRLHTHAATQTLADYDTDQVFLARFVVALGVTIAIVAFLVAYLLNLLRRSLGQQASAEAALARSQERMHHMQKIEALGQLVGGVAHDFNNLLTVILGQTTLLRTIGTHDEETDAYLGHIQQASEQAAALTQQLLTFSRRQKTAARIFDLTAFVRNRQRILRRLIGENIKVSEAYDESPCVVELDPGQVEQVLINLVVNARDAMPNGGQLWIATANFSVAEEDSNASLVPPGDYVKLQVRDDGSGIDHDIRERIFDPFFTTKSKERGTGLGLATVHGIVESASGQITVESQPGQGTVFDVCFPRSDAQPEPDTDDAEFLADRGGSETILLVEDDEQIRQFAIAGLEHLGYRVLAAAGGDEALGICRKEKGPIDLIVSDVIMPDMNGPQVMGHALTLRPDAVPLYISGYTDDIVLQGGVDGADVPLIHKPFTLDELARQIRSCLDTRPARSVRASAHS